MSKKRQATTELNHDNWDEEEEQEDPGQFAAAPKDRLSERKILSARRRKPGDPDERSGGIFAGFKGFGQTAKIAAPNFSTATANSLAAPNFPTAPASSFLTAPNFSTTAPNLESKNVSAAANFTTGSLFGSRETLPGLSSNLAPAAGSLLKFGNGSGC